MQEQKGAVTLHGNPFTLLGTPLTAGTVAPEFSVLANDLGMVNLSDFGGQVCILLTVPSLDTPVCDTEIRRFNQAAAHLDPDIRVLVISMDLPFAQQRWCGAAGIKNVQTLSDHREGTMGLDYGVLIKELRLLARAAFVIDRQGTVQYVEIVREIADQPDYEAILAAARDLL